MSEFGRASVRRRTGAERTMAGETGRRVMRARAAWMGERWRREVRRMLDQQCWVWGRDVSRVEGNLLLEYGMERMRAPEGMSGCSQYTLRGGPVCGGEGLTEVRVWGFGVMFGQDGAASGAEAGVEGVYLNRFEALPRRVERMEAFCQAKEMAVLVRGGSLQTVAQGLRWMAGYEAWVLARCGVGYRRQSVEARGRPGVEVEGVPEGWRRLAREVEARAAGPGG